MLPVILAAGVCIVLGRKARDDRAQLLQAVSEASTEDESAGSTAHTDGVGDDEPPVGRHQLALVERPEGFVARSRRDQLAELGSDDETREVTDEERALNRYLVGATVSFGTAIVSIAYPPLLVVTLGTALYSTMLIFKSGYNALVHERRLRLDVLGSLYFIGAYAGGYFIAGSFGLAAYYASQKLVLRTQDRSQRSLVDIFGKHPRTAWLLVDGSEVEVPVEQLHAGDIIVVQAGQVVPVDGVIRDGFATIDQHMLTGEAQPAEKDVGDQVLTATLVVAGRIFLEVEKTGEETVAAQIGTMLNNTASYQASIVSKGEAVADKSAGPTILLALVTWPLSGYKYMVTVLGSAIGLNIKITGPIAMLNFLNVAATNGVLVKDGRSLELLQDIDTVVFDKTGTLTLDQPRIAGVHICAEVDADTVLMYAAAAEHRQTHPIARAILAEADRRGLVLPEIDNASYQMGYGLSVRTDGHLIRVGSDRYMALENIEVPEGIRAAMEAGSVRGHSTVMVAVDDQLVGALELEPVLRPEAKEVVADLRNRGLEMFIISGDQEEATREMAEALGIPNYFANTLPEEKSLQIARLQSEGRSVCFVGDGINDSIALKKANVSISMRGASTAATDTAQMVLMGNGLGQLPFVFDLAKEFDGNMKAGFAVAVGQGVIVIAGAMLGVIGIIPGTAVWSAGLVAGLGIAQFPMWRHHERPGTDVGSGFSPPRKELPRQAGPDGLGAENVPQPARST